MTASFILLALCLLGKWVTGLPDFSDLVPDTPTTPPENEDFQYSSFFEIYSGVPPLTTVSPEPPDIYGPNPSLPPVPSYQPVAPPVPSYQPDAPPVPLYQPDAPPAQVPTRAPAQPSQPPPPTPQPTPGIVSATRSMSYQYFWSGRTQGCEYNVPRALLQCLDGGVLLVEKMSNANCEALALDIVRCTQVDQGSDASVDFDCVGITPRHLTAKTKTLPSQATDCAAPMGPTRGGSATATASLRRYCKNSATGEVILDDSFSCKGNSTDNSSTINAFCTSTKQCTGTNCTLVVDPIAITASNKNNNCSEPETRQDLTDFRFNPSSLVSYHVVKWTFSDRAFKCDWQVPDIEIRCENGGTIQNIQKVSFCDTTSAGDAVICTNPNPESEEGRIIVELDFWCFGNDVDQLILEARTLQVDESDFLCEPGGLIVQGLDVSRGCGELNTDNFVVIKTPSFCKDISQFRDDLCFAGFTCPAGKAACADVSVDSVAADSSNLLVGSCFYAEQLS